MSKYTFEQFCDKMLTYKKHSVAAKRLAEKYPEYYPDFLRMVQQIKAELIRKARDEYQKHGQREAEKTRRRKVYASGNPFIGT